MPNTNNNSCSRLFLAVLLLACLAGPAGSGEETWLLVDTSSLVLMVIEGNRVVHTFADISIGRYGASRDKVVGDNQTPIGEFRIGWITDKTRFHRFMGLNYPDAVAARQGFERGLIDEEEWRRIRYALNTGNVPPQNTILGGMIGIHGIGKGDIEMHGQFNWTNGCVALTNEEIELLSKWVHIGTRVQIH